MIKKTLYFGNPAYLSLRHAQLVIQIPDVQANDTLTPEFKKMNERTIPIEDIGMVVLDNRRITITSGVIECLLDNNCAFITCDSKSMPTGLMLCSSSPYICDIVPAKRIWKFISNEYVLFCLNMGK